MSPQLEPEPAFSLDVCKLKAYLTFEDGDLVFVMHDGNQAITIEAAPNDPFSWANVIAGAERLADMAAQYAALVRIRGGNPAPVRRFQRPADEVKWWLPPVNGAPSILPSPAEAER